MTESTNKQPIQTEVYRLSWSVFVVRGIILFVLAVALFGTIAHLLHRGISVGDLIFSVILILLFAWILLGIIHDIKVKIYVNNDGIWRESGLFPWNKGVSGMNWRDISEAVYRTGFLSWALNSYTIIIRHRYTKGSEMWFRHVKNGDKLVQSINKIVNEKNLY